MVVCKKLNVLMTFTANCSPSDMANNTERFNTLKLHLGYEARLSGWLRINFDRPGIFAAWRDFDTQAFSLFAHFRKNGRRGRDRTRVLNWPP